jgi:DNA mismatch repair protein MSH6
MRQKSAKAGGKKAPAGKEIVRRELKHVLTNGTISDAAYLAGDDASQCICIKVCQTRLLFRVRTRSGRTER